MNAFTTLLIVCAVCGTAYSMWDRYQTRKTLEAKYKYTGKTGGEDDGEGE